MGASIAIFFLVPFISRTELRSSKFRYLSKILFWAFVADVFLLGYLGGQVAEEPFITISQLASTYYFLHFMVLLNVAYGLEKKAASNLDV